MAPKDVEAGESEPLTKKRYPWLMEHEKVPVGGIPGNKQKFLNDVTLAFRTAFFACILASAIWIPSMKWLFPQGFLKFIPVSILIIFFTINKIFGTIVGNATAALIGTWWAVFNIFMLRGFFPDGVTPGMGWTSPAFIVGWIDLVLFYFFFLATDMRMGVRMFAMAGTTGYMLAFLNPHDESIYSKNFKINPDGIAVSNLKVTVVCLILTMMANLLPIPFGFATDEMKAKGKEAAAFVAKKFLSSTDYYRGSKASKIIEREIAGTQNVARDVGNLGAAISGAWYEGFDIGIRGTVRKLHETQADLLSSLVDIIKAVEIAISTEDFGKSHQKIMGHVGEACSDLVEAAGYLLMIVTYAAGDGVLDEDECKELGDQVKEVKSKIKALAKAFNIGRQDPNLFSHAEPPRKPEKIDGELLNEAFFVFAISAYGRKVCEYAEMLESNPPSGESIVTTFTKCIKDTFLMSGLPANHGPFVARSMIALITGFIYACTLDSYSGACAVTIVFMMTTNVAPAIGTTLKVLTASTIASVVGGSIIYERVCSSGQGGWLLPITVFIYWWGSLYVSFSGCQYALIGLLMAALSPFVLVVECPSGDVSGTGGAVAMWISIRGFMMALFIVTMCEYLSTTKTMAKWAQASLNEGMIAIEDALEVIMGDGDPTDALAPVSKAVGDASMYSGFATEEPRMYKCKWKHALLTEVSNLTGLMRLDLMFMRHAMCGTKDESQGCFAYFEKVDAWKAMKQDIEDSLANAKDLVIALLAHEQGEFKAFPDGFDRENLDTLDGYEECIQGLNEMSGGITFPSKDAEIETIEDDLLTQMSIIFVMLDYVNKRFAACSRAAVRES
jgi:hypothetical protein